jgi:Fe-S oxidoreductase
MMIYFRGCVVREKLKNISKATEELLLKADVEYNVLRDESCCGSFLLRTGFLDEAVEVMMTTLDMIEDKKILASCPGCYRTFRDDYPKILGVKLDVVHTSQLFNHLIQDGRLETKIISQKVTYHDPCHLGRYCGEYHAPRNVMGEIVDLVEMEGNKEESRCCGAGAGVKSILPDVSLDIAKMRMDDARKVGVDTVVTSCPFCILNLSYASRNDERILDLSEIIIMGIEDEKI